MKVLIIGKSGQLANELTSNKPTGIEHLCLGRSDIDVSDVTSLEKAINTYKPKVIINASAYTAVDKAETDSNAAYLLNQQAVENLAIIAKKSNTRLIHVSTDFVFDGKKNKAYNVDDKTNPCSIYGASKLAGEQAITTHYSENSAIVRTSWLYSSHGNNFVKTMLRLMQEKEELGVVCDQIGCPTYAEGLAKFLWKLTKKETISPIYHWSDYGVASWYDFAVAIQEIAFNNKLLSKKIPIKPIPASSYPTPATRPIFSLLNASNSYPIEPSKHWTRHLTECIKKLNYKASSRSL
ncbi:dTDP-4-dehydrorhamnose reductase [Pseudocolwellia agarivorans]|uniref:dTDP-4-dehydrorhamnose reductase n=1 Tax=Pseudocolwellia agarivorans TaxID=1911682 RepID=UPI000986FBE6|nr:dTDP-4-dehydrorhamnose reductase [Pseudocolwellia agarivorans]